MHSMTTTMHSRTTVKPLTTGLSDPSPAAPRSVLLDRAEEQLLILSHTGDLPSSILRPSARSPPANLLREVLHAKAEMLVQHLLRRRETKGVHVRSGVGVPAPAEARPCLDGDDEGLRRGDDFSAVLGGLAVEER